MFDSIFLDDIDDFILMIYIIYYEAALYKFITRVEPWFWCFFRFTFGNQMKKYSFFYHKSSPRAFCTKLNLGAISSVK